MKNRERHPEVKEDLRRQAAVPEAERCEVCDGTGNRGVFTRIRCEACDGTGRRGGEPRRD
jgi:DnaJ-class molecular chaperone